MSLVEALFAPRRIALIGASSDPARLTARAQIYLRRHGFSGMLYPINPRAKTVLGEPAFPALAAVPGPVDFAYILLPAALMRQAVIDCAEAHVPVACILADGFADAGLEGAALQQELVELAQAGGVRLLGPNSMGMINVPAAIACSVNAALEAEELLPGHLSLISHSGSVMGALISRAAARGIGFAKLIGTGNEADLSVGELLGFLVDDPATSTILLFLETIRDPGRMAAAARRAHAAGKPVIAYKLGKSEAVSAFATTHTGAILGSDAATDAFFSTHGILRVDMLETLFEIPPLAAAGPPSAPRRAVRIVTTTGGAGAMVVDRLGLAGIATAHMHDTTLIGARKSMVAEALSEARNAPDADLAVAVIGSSAQFRPQETVAGVLAATGKNPLVAFLAPEASASLRLLTGAGIAAFRTPEACADAVRAYLDWQPPRAFSPAIDVSHAKKLLPAATDEAGARAVFAALGLPNGALTIDPDAPPPLTYPVALKALSPTIAHKTEAGAVALDIADAASLCAAASAMRARPRAHITGFLAQPMARGVAEVILGFRRDPSVGPIVLLGVGGVLAEIHRDVTLRLAPVSETEAAEMIEQVKSLAPARGYRGLPKGDLVALAQAIAEFSHLAALSDVAEAEINPVIVMPEGKGIVVADASLKVQPATSRGR